MLAVGMVDTRHVAQRLGEYVLLRRVAAGGMGEVFLARAKGVAGFERPVAIKKILPHLSREKTFVDMLIKEAKLTVQLNHPNIVQVYDLSEDQGEYYIAMEYVPGIAVGAMLQRCAERESQMPVELAVHVALKTLKGLDYAHTLRGADGQPLVILHRDVTPQNIMVTREAWVKVMDFGIAKARNELNHTIPGMLKGKVGYFAPEQLTGQPSDLRVDLFCVGIFLWECLATRRLFKGADEADTFRLIASSEIPPLSEFRDDVPQEVEQVIRRALKRDPDERFSSAQSFYDALAEALFPRSVDDIEDAAKRYLARHDDYFAGVITGTQELPDMMTEPTDPVLRAPVAEPPEGKSRKASNGRFATASLLFGFLLAVLGGLAWIKREPSAPLTPLTQSEVMRTLGALGAELRGCLPTEGQGAAANGRVLLSVAQDGQLAHLAFEPELSSQATQSCLSEVIESVSFTSHNREMAVFEIPLRNLLGAGNGHQPEAYRLNDLMVPAPPLTNSEVRGFVEQASAELASCFRNAPRRSGSRRFDITLSIDPAGRVTESAFNPSLPEGALQRCLRRSLGQVETRRHSVVGYKAKLQLRWKRGSLTVL